MITFEEDQSPGYRERTIKNASADLTLAFAIDFNSAGERLTKASVPKNKKYLPIHIDTFDMSYDSLANLAMIHCFGMRVQTINIAGNGIYTMKKYYNQQQCDEYVYKFLDIFFETDYIQQDMITLIRSGGQTGFDEAGLKAAVRLGIPALCLAPKGWKFRDINGVDISDEKQFKARFDGNNNL